MLGCRYNCSYVGADGPSLFGLIMLLCYIHPVSLVFHSADFIIKGLIGMLLYRSPSIRRASPLSGVECSEARGLVILLPAGLPKLECSVSPWLSGGHGKLCKSLSGE